MSQILLPESIRRVIEEKCGSIVSLSLAWERSASSAVASGASEGDVVSLVREFKSSRTLDAFVHGAADESQGVPGFLSELRSLVDESSFDFSSWLGAFEVVQTHLIANARRASVSSIVGYVQCSAEFGGSSESRESLPEIISGMIDQYGFEGQEGCGTG